ncbi:hypothetical protein EJB05_56343, partial [Eragrostis curvula]
MHSIRDSYFNFARSLVVDNGVESNSAMIWNSSEEVGLQNEQGPDRLEMKPAETNKRGKPKTKERKRKQRGKKKEKEKMNKDVYRKEPENDTSRSSLDCRTKSSRKFWTP